MRGERGGSGRFEGLGYKNGRWLTENRLCEIMLKAYLRSMGRFEFWENGNGSERFGK